MKTLKLIACIVMLSAYSSFAQTPATPTPPPAPEKPVQTAQPMMSGERMARPGMPMGMQPGMKMNRYLVQIPHTKENCKAVTDEMKTKSAPLLMRFDWACAAGDHTGYAIMPGASEDAIRKQLPEGLQKTAKITKVDKITPAQGAAPMHN